MRPRLPSPALVVACISLFLALGGLGYAGKTLPRNSVGTKQLKANAVNSAKVAPNSLLGADIKESSLGLVPNADKIDGLDSTAFAGAVSEAWHVVGAVGEPAFYTDGCGVVAWTNYNGGASPFTKVSFFKDTQGIVHLQGLAGQACAGGTGAGTPIFFLPAGYRPGATAVFSALSNNTANRVNVSDLGLVSPELPVGAAGLNWVSLDGISFRAEN